MTTDAPLTDDELNQLETEEHRYGDPNITRLIAEVRRLRAFFVVTPERSGRRWVVRGPLRASIETFTTKADAQACADRMNAEPIEAWIDRMMAGR